VHYGFENPSNIDTPFLVAHRFDQTYVVDNQWFVVTARYPLFGDTMRTEFGVTPERTTTASDFDTFYDPNNDVVVSGTSGDVSMHSIRFGHWSEAKLWGVPMYVGYLYRRDVSDFAPADRVVTHTNPPSVTRTPVTTHEMTISRMQELPIGGSTQFEIAPHWLLTAGGDVSPITNARLTTILPEKYPGQEIVFEATVAAVTGRMQLDWQRAAWPVTITFSYGRTFNYQSASQFSRDALQVGVRVGLNR